MVDHRPIDDSALLEPHGEVLNGEIAHDEVAEATEHKGDGFVRGASGLRQFWAALGDSDGVDGKLLLLVMELELEAVGEKLLHHDVLLLPGRYALDVGDAVKVVTLGGEPGGRAHDLRWVQAIREFDQHLHGEVRGAEMPAAEADMAHPGFAGFDGDDIERGVGVGGHGFRRRGRARSSLRENRDSSENENSKLESK